MSIKIENWSVKLAEANNSKPVFLKPDDNYTGEAIEMSEWRNGKEAIQTTCGKVGAVDFISLCINKCPDMIIKDDAKNSVEVVMGKTFVITVKGGVMTNVKLAEASSEEPAKAERPQQLDKKAYEALSEDDKKHYSVLKKGNNQFDKAVLIEKVD